MALTDLFASDTLKEVLQGVDALATSAEERGRIKLELIKSVLEAEKSLISSQASIIIAEAQGSSWLQRSWRPIGMMVFISIVAYNYIIRDILGMVVDELPLLTIPDGMWTLLTIGFGGYVVGRSAEKITKSVSGSNLFSGDKISKQRNKALLKELKRALKRGDQETADKILAQLGGAKEAHGPAGTGAMG